jgi:hypothetical protein
MKSIDTVIFNHILSNPKFSKNLQKAKCFVKLKLLFELKLGINPRICDAISYMIQKQDTLLVAISHPAFAMELKYNSAKIIKLLNSNYKDNIIDIKECLSGFENIKKMQTFIPNHNTKLKPTLVAREYKRSDFYYDERSLGIFVNNIENEAIKDIFEQIRTSIKTKNNLQKNKENIR